MRTHDVRTTDSSARVAVDVGLEVSAVAVSAGFGTSAFGGVYNVSEDTITLQTDGTFDFGTKPTEQKPLLVWHADDGYVPNTLWGRSSSFIQDKSERQFSTDLPGPGGVQSLYMDHNNNSGAVLGGVAFDSDQLYMFRREYCNFDLAKSYSIRSRATDFVDGVLPSPGDTVTGASSGETGVVDYASPVDGLGRSGIQYLVDQGTVGNHDNPADFTFGETMTFPGGSCVNAEGSETYPYGILRGLNNKISRMWAPTKNNIYTGTIAIDNQFDGRSITAEHTDGTYWGSSWDNEDAGYLTDFAWVDAQWVYQASDVDTENGIYWWYNEGAKVFENQRFVHRDAEKPDKYNEIFNAQVSNGAQPNTIRHMDYMYVDTDWCRVILMDADYMELDLNNGPATKMKTFPLPTISWVGDEIKVHNLSKYHPTATHIGVINSVNALVAVCSIA